MKFPQMFKVIASYHDIEEHYVKLYTCVHVQLVYTSAAWRLIERSLCRVLFEDSA
jgi:hypothetical protein